MPIAVPAVAGDAVAARPDTGQRRRGLLPSLDPLGTVLAAILLAGTLALPFLAFRPNRIAAAETIWLWDAGPSLAAMAVLGLQLVLAAVLATGRSLRLRLALAVVAVLASILFLGVAAGALTPAGDRLARVAPAAGFWTALLALGLTIADGLSRLRLAPAMRLAILAAAIGTAALILTTGTLDQLSLLKEYANYRDRFWSELLAHALLSASSAGAAAAIGIPLAIACHGAARLRAPTLQVLAIVQTIPSIALFGLLMVPLGWLGSHVPAAAALGVRGIGAAPAWLALVLYSLLPIVATTLAGLAQVQPAVLDAARGMGLSPRQRLLEVELPIALPTILTGVRIGLVQAVGLATVAALIGGGGLGVLVFQGVGQTALDLVLLGALPIVAMGFVASVVLDALIAAIGRQRR